MNPHDESPQGSEKDIISAFEQASNEQPSRAMDEQILSAARASTQTQEAHSQKLKRPNKFLVWLFTDISRWEAPFALATVAFVSFMLVQYFPPRQELIEANNAPEADFAPAAEPREAAKAEAIKKSNENEPVLSRSQSADVQESMMQERKMQAARMSAQREKPSESVMAAEQQIQEELHSADSATLESDVFSQSNQSDMPTLSAKELTDELSELERMLSEERYDELKKRLENLEKKIKDQQIQQLLGDEGLKRIDEIRTKLLKISA